MNELETAVTLLDYLPPRRRAKFVLATVRCGKCRDPLVEVLDTSPPVVVWHDLQTADELAGAPPSSLFTTPDDPDRFALPPRADAGPLRTIPRKSDRRVLLPLDQLTDDGIGGVCRCRFMPLHPSIIWDLIASGQTESVIK